MAEVGTALVAVVIALGVVGVVVPLVPGSALVWLAVAGWAVAQRDTPAWVTLAVVTAVLAATWAVKWLWPARRLRAADVSTPTLVAGGVLGVVGFFVIPVLGLVIGFVLGVLLAELVRRSDARRAWAATRHAVAAVALSMGVELTGALLAAAVWVVSVWQW